MSTRTKASGRKRLSAAARRELIATAATELFAERGYPGASIEEIARRSFDAWFSYVEHYPAAAKMLFREPSGDREAEAVHREVSARSRAQVMELFAAEPGSEGLTGSLAGPGMEMAWVVLRGVLQGLALWWVEHPEVPREQVVATAMNSLWIGFERAAAGEGWAPPAQEDQPG